MVDFRLMSDDFCEKEFDCRKLQIELNRQALVSLGKRLAELEEKMAEMYTSFESISSHLDQALLQAKRFKQLLSKMQQPVCVLDVEGDD